MLRTKGAVKRAERPYIRCEELKQKPTLAWVHEQLLVYELPRADHQQRISPGRLLNIRWFMRVVFDEREPIGQIHSVTLQTPPRESSLTLEVIPEKVPRRMIRSARGRGAAKRWWAPSGFGSGTSKQDRLR
jgi:hypothetical protein